MDRGVMDDAKPLVGDDIAGVLAASRRSRSLAEWLPATLEAIDAGLGFRRCSLLLALTSYRRSAPRAFAGAQRGMDANVLAEYFGRWADSDPLATEPAHESFRQHGFAHTRELYPELAAPQRRFVDRFLSSIGVIDQLSVRLPGNGTSDGYLTIHHPQPIDAATRTVVEDLGVGLARPLRSFLPRGLPGTLSVRERQAVELVAFGLTNAEIAGVLNVGRDTVKKHLLRASGKLGVERRAELAVTWMTGRRLPRPLARAGRSAQTSPS